MDSRYIILSDFGDETNSLANDGIWTVEVKNNEDWIKIADFDSFMSFNGKHESQVVQNAIEQGHFRSVNKIRKPNTCTVELGKGGLQQDIQLVLDSLIKLKESTDLLRIRTPFGLMTEMNLIGLDYSFSQNMNSNMLVAKLTLQEIQTIGKVEEYNQQQVKNAENTNTQNSGQKPLQEM